MIGFIVIIILEIIFYNATFSSVTSVSSIKACINDGSGDLLKQQNGTACEKKLVVAMTIEANEGKSQYLEANIHQVHDSTTNQNLELKTQVRVKITKSPVLINYRLYQVGYVNSKPYEEIRKKKGKRCRDDWYSKNSEAACGFQYDSDDDAIFDSQGLCCKCSLKGSRYDRGESVNCLGKGETAHCLTLNELYMFVFGLYPPQLQFEIEIIVEKLIYTKKDGTPVYEEVEQMTVGPTKRIVNSKNFTIRVEYVADFYPNTFMPVLNDKYLMIPDLKKMNEFSDEWFEEANITGYSSSVKNASEWLLVDKQLFDFSGLHCNKIGVSYTAFRNQEDGCTNRAQWCLQGQPYSLWKEDHEKKQSNQKTHYQLHSFGRVHSIPHSKGKTDFQLNFIADKQQRSFITVSLEADSLKVVINKSPGRIVEAYIDPFEALSIDGQLDVYVQNIGGITATYSVAVGHCSGGIDWVPSKSVTLDPGEETNVTFIIHSFHSIGQDNKCEVELLDQTAQVLDNLTIVFETLDTCFCYGYCGCSCGNNVSDCPPKPVFKGPDRFRNINYFNIPSIKRLQNIAFWASGGLGALSITGLVVIALIGLGVLKVLLMYQTGELKTKHIHKPCTIALLIVRKVCSKLAETFSILTFGIINLKTNFVGTTKDKNRAKYVGRETLSRRPLNCDGMCHGAKRVRRIHRKKLRLMKRRGAKIDKVGPWWENKYECTCIIKDTKDIFEICKGLCFFIYCPVLPLWWSIEISYEWIQGRKRKTKRIREFQAKKEERKKKQDNTYLLLDKYTRGTKEKKVLDFEAEKMKAKEKEEKEMKAMEEGKMPRVSSDEEFGLDSSDTTATDEAYDLDELTNPGYPVYMNYAGVRSNIIPKSLKSPGKRFSIKGRLIEKETDNGRKVYIFDLYKYTKQIKSQLQNETPIELNPNEFKQSLLPNVVQLLITLSPLFTCLNK